MTDLDPLAAALTTSTLLTDPDVVDAYRRDEAHPAPAGRPLAVLAATSTEDVATALAWADEHRVPVVPRGAGTGLAGGASAIDGCLVVSTTRMRSILELAPDDELAVVQPGVVTADLDRAAADHGLMYAPDPSSVETCTIGGNVATNAGGLRCVKYGVTRDSVLGLEAVLAGGRVVRTGHRTVKGVAGYDLTGLFVGSEGTLGIVTEVTVRLRPRPVRPPVTIAATFGALRAAGDAVAAVVRAGIGPSLLELVDRATLASIDEWRHTGLEPDTRAMLVAQTDGPDAADAAEAVARCFDAAGATGTIVSSDAAEAAELLAMRRLAYPAAERLGRCLVEDVGVPRSRLPEMLAFVEDTARRHDVTILTVAHAGDGNVHPTFVYDPTDTEDGVPEAVWTAADAVFRHALTLGGTLTGEHGVGQLKRRWLGLELGDDVLDLHRSVKAAFDPHGILNPGKVF